MHSSYLILLYFQYRRSSNDLKKFNYLNKNKSNLSFNSNLSLSNSNSSFNSNLSKAETVRVFQDQKSYYN